MKSRGWFPLLLVTGLLLSAGVASADLIDRGGGLIYDPERNLTWYDFTQPVSGYVDASNWAASLTVHGYSDWRLPTALNLAGGAPCDGYACTGSEFGDLFFTELGNKGYFTPPVGVGYGLTKPGPFTNLHNTWYWTSTFAQCVSGWCYFYLFDVAYGHQTTGWMYGGGNALAVRDGDVTPAPEPGAWLLLGIGLLALGCGLAESPRHG